MPEAYPIFTYFLGKLISKMWLIKISQNQNFAISQVSVTFTTFGREGKGIITSIENGAKLRK